MRAAPDVGESSDILSNARLDDEGYGGPFDEPTRAPPADRSVRLWQLSFGNTELVTLDSTLPRTRGPFGSVVPIGNPDDSKSPGGDFLHDIAAKTEPSPRIDGLR